MMKTAPPPVVAYNASSMGTRSTAVRLVVRGNVHESTATVSGIPPGVLPVLSTQLPMSAAFSSGPASGADACVAL